MTLGCVFLLAAGSKGTDLIRFSRQIESLIVSTGVSVSGYISIAAGILCVVIILAELVLGAMLVTNYRSRDASRISVVLMVGFLGLAVWGIISRSMLECSCFGPLLERSAGSAIIEDLILLGFAITGAFYPSIHKPKRVRITVLLIVAGIGWSLLFYIFPPGWSAMRVGAKWRSFTTEPVLTLPDHLAIWVFETECDKCQEQVDILNLYANSELAPLICGLTDCTPGRLAEFKLDFQPSFSLYRTDKKNIRRLGITTGDIIEIRRNEVSKISHLTEIHGMMQESLRSRQR